MAASLIEVPVQSLKVGMYVAELDRPWLETPFMLQGFYVETAEDVAKIAEFCEFVRVDPRRAVRTESAVMHTPADSLRKRLEHAKASGTKSFVKKEVAFKDEYLTVKSDFESAERAVARVFETLKKGGHLDVLGIKRAINPLIDSVLRNRDALAALVRMSKKDDYTYGHSIATAVWAVVLGRHLGFDQHALRVLALGSALLDVGKSKFPDSLLKKEGALTDEETAFVRRHVEFSLDLVRESGAQVDPGVLEVIEHHHERNDGSGYPAGLEGNDIPLSARIAGLADSYDAMITARPYAKARSSFEAMQEFSDLRGVKFQAELVEQLMQAIGLFPTGSLVELNSGEVGIVTAQNPTRRLLPKVMLVLDRDKQPLPSFAVVDLLTTDSGEGAANLWIATELAPGAYGLEAEDYYL